MKNLKDAMRNDDFQSVMQIIQSGQVDVNANVAGDPSGNTPLTYAVRNGKIEIVLNLLQAGVDVNKRDTKDNRSPLHYAVIRGDLNLVTLLLDRGADKQDHAALHEAAYQGNAIVLRELLERGADVNSKNDNRTLLENAALKSGIIVPVMKQVIEDYMQISAKSAPSGIIASIRSFLTSDSSASTSAAMPTAAPVAKITGVDIARLEQERMQDAKLLSKTNSALGQR
jgi:hypothetical protein